MKKIICNLALLLLCSLLISASASPYDSHVLTQSRDEGSCRMLAGEVEMVVLCVSIPQAEWDAQERSALKEQVEKAADELEKEAAGWGVALDIIPEYHEVSVEAPSELDSDWVEDMIKQVDTLRNRRTYKHWKSSPLLLCFDHAGRAYAQTRYGSSLEYLVLFEDEQAEVIRHETLHLFGAEDLYIHRTVKDAAEQLYPYSIMLGAEENGTVDSLTAYLVGWAEEPDRTAAQFLAQTQHLTQEELYASLDEEMFTGEGVFPQDDGVYTGQMVDGCFHGTGTYEWDDGSSYSGQWDWNVRHGKGTYTWASGVSYTGDFDHGARSGSGVLTWTNGDVYTGQFADGKQNGSGVMKWHSGDVYTGDFANDTLHGFGTYQWAGGDSYTGWFENGLKHGQGTLTWADGGVYTGMFTDGAITGWGIMSMANGDRYEGEFLNAQFHGQGTYTYADGTVKTGTWESGRMIE